ncbi:neprilysin-2 isoform X2 [Diachasma alloeum]|uniref:neprilysin-2 isoform X2 n=1 Tax=Diachasma alloeum TaxID=454923 RepID=UPI000738365A|nr:neprilysin-2 isoform X2 [Diachasma alloeum]
MVRIGIIGFIFCSLTLNVCNDEGANAEALPTIQPAKSLPPFTEEPHRVCTTKVCNDTASMIITKMDRKVKPCDNFYRFACGNYLNNTLIPPDRRTMGAFEEIEIEIQKQLRLVLEEPSLPMEPKAYKLAKKLYKSCMNETAIEAQDFKPLLSILQKLGGWPVLEGDQWNEETFNWTQSVYNLSDLGYFVNYFFKISIEVDFKNTTKHVLYLDQASLKLSREYLTEDLNKTIEYYSYMVNVAVVLGAKEEFAEKELLQSLKFEMELANISLPEEKRRNLTLLYNPMTIAQLSQTYPSIPWKEYFNRLLPPSIRVDDSEIVIVVVPSFITNLEKLMNEIPKRIQANYMMWRAVTASLKYLIPASETQRESRWKECVNIVLKHLSRSVDVQYVRKYFNKDAKKNTIEMVDDMRKQFNQILQNLDWMDDETRKSALEKATSMTSHIAYPDVLLDERKLEEFYHDLELSDENYLQNILNLTLFKTKYSFSKLRKPVNKSDWRTEANPTTVNAFYSPDRNSIYLPAGILQGAFFNNDRPRYVNYGAIGFLIGHEMTHAFDDMGRQFDKEGNLVDWWAPSTKEKYLAKAQCFIDQYGNYSVEEVGLNLNGINTQGENIADNGGMKLAYLTYKDWSARNGREPMLPRLPYTPRQMIWISAASTWCEKHGIEYLKQLVKVDPHIPEEFRILGVLSNMPEFAEDFKCPVGSRMNPKKKCSMW